MEGWSRVGAGSWNGMWGSCRRRHGPHGPQGAVVHAGPPPTPGVMPSPLTLRIKRRSGCVGREGGGRATAPARARRPGSRKTPALTKVTGRESNASRATEGQRVSAEIHTVGRKSSARCKIFLCKTTGYLHANPASLKLEQFNSNGAAKYKCSRSAAPFLLFVLG